MTRRSEAAAIWLSHGPIDAITTYLVFLEQGIWRESNPLIQELLIYPPYVSIGFICLFAGIAALLWTPAADAIDAPSAVAYGIAAIGLVVAAGNMWVFFL